MGTCAGGPPAGASARSTPRLGPPNFSLCCRKDTDTTDYILYFTKTSLTERSEWSLTSTCGLN